MGGKCSKSDARTPLSNVKTNHHSFSWLIDVYQGKDTTSIKLWITEHILLKQSSWEEKVRKQRSEYVQMIQDPDC